MKKHLLLLLIFVLLLQSAFCAFSIVAAKTESQPVQSYVPNSKLTLKDAEALVGRKFTLKEQVGWLLFKKQIQNQIDIDKERANTNATLGLVFGIMSIFIFPLFAIPGLILSNKAVLDERLSPGILRSKGVAKAGQITSWIGIALLVLASIIIVAVLAYGGVR